MQGSDSDKPDGKAGSGADASKAGRSGDDRVEITVLLDADVVSRLKRLGPDWQEKVNAILKDARLDDPNA